MSGLPVDDGRCFACGPENAIGLRMDFERSGDGVVAHLRLRPEFQGWQGIAHGGIAIALLDEVMAHAAGAAGHRGVTASLEARFRKPVPLDQPLVVFGRVTGTRRNVLSLEGRVSDAAGKTLVEGTARFLSRGPLEAVDDRRNPNSDASER